MPEDADTPRFRTTIGSVYYVPEKSAIVWKIKQFGGGKEFLMRAELGLPSVKGSTLPHHFAHGTNSQLIWTKGRDRLN